MDPSRDPGGGGRGSALRTVLLGVAVTAVAVLGLGVAGLVASRQTTAGDVAAPAVPEAGEPATLAERPPPGERFRLPDTTLEGFGGGGDVALRDFRGQPLVVNFWATWCAPCVQEMPAFAEVADDLSGRVTFLGVNVQDAPANAEPFAAELGVEYPLASDPDAELYREVRAFGMPTTLFVRPNGMVVYRHTGALDAERLRALLSERLGVRS